MKSNEFPGGSTAAKTSIKTSFIKVGISKFARMKTFSIVLLAYLILGYSIHAHGQKTNYDKVTDISARQFLDLTNNREGIVLDVRTPAETAQGHIEGASFIDFYDEGFEQKMDLIQKDKPIYIYCRSGGRSAKAAEIMLRQGFIEIYNLDGGILAWEEAGYQIVISEDKIDKNIKELTVDDFNKLLATEQPMLVDFHTVWCAPCKKMAPIVDDLQKDFEGRAIVLRVDADKSKALARKYNIQGVPVFLVFKNGVELWRGTGLMDESTLRKAITTAF